MIIYRKSLLSDNILKKKKKKKKPFEVNLFRPWAKISQLIVARKLNRTLL